MVTQEAGRRMGEAEEGAECFLRTELPWCVLGGFILLSWST